MLTVCRSGTTDSINFTEQERFQRRPTVQTEITTEEECHARPGTLYTKISKDFFQSREESRVGELPGGKADLAIVKRQPEKQAVLTPLFHLSGTDPESAGYLLGVQHLALRCQDVTLHLLAARPSSCQRITARYSLSRLLLLSSIGHVRSHLTAIAAPIGEEPSQLASEHDHAHASIFEGSSIFSPRRSWRAMVKQSYRRLIPEELCSAGFPRCWRQRGVSSDSSSAFEMPRRSERSSPVAARSLVSANSCSCASSDALSLRNQRLTCSHITGQGRAP